MNPLQTIRMIFRDHFDDPAMVVDAETSPASVPEWDSVAQIHLVLAVEEAFEMRFTTDEVANLHSVGDILHILQSRG